MEQNTDAAPQSLPRDTTPTWEIELLISGALVFALLQVPELMQEWYLRREVQASPDLRMFLWFSQVYATVVVYALIGTFVMHISARAYWVALIGVHSVFPKGPRWDQFSQGPVMRALTQSRTEPLPAVIARADNRASLIFGFGVLIVMLSLMVLAFTLVLIGVSTLLNMLVVPSEMHQWTVLWLVAGMTVPLLALNVIDRWVCSRLPPTHRLTRYVDLGLRLYAPVFGLGWLAPLMPVMTTNLGRRRGTVLVLGALYSLLFIVMFEQVNRAKDLMSGADLPALRHDEGMHPAHYATTRIDDLRYSNMPFVQAEQIEDAWLRLFVPYVPHRHTPAIRARCPGVVVNPDEDDEDAAAQRGEWLRCFGDLLAVKLDDAAIADLRFDVGSDPVSGQRGIVAMIDVRDLPPGRHVLRVMRLPRFDDGPEAEMPKADRIVFWR